MHRNPSLVVGQRGKRTPHNSSVGLVDRTSSTSAPTSRSRPSFPAPLAFHPSSSSSSITSSPPARGPALRPRDRSPHTVSVQQGSDGFLNFDPIHPVSPLFPLMGCSVLHLEQWIRFPVLLVGAPWGKFQTCRFLGSFAAELLNFPFISGLRFPPQERTPLMILSFLILDAFRFGSLSGCGDLWARVDSIFV